MFAIVRLVLKEMIVKLTQMSVIQILAKMEQRVPNQPRTTL
jgi:hypothetical protein